MKIRNSTTIIILSVFLITGWAIPASLWFSPQSLTVVQVNPGDVPTVTLSRGIRWSFRGTYTADVRDVNTTLIACGRGGAHHYRGGLSGAISYPLDVFAGGDKKCADLDEGAYWLETCWTVETPLWGVLPPKTVCISSNPFRVSRGLMP